MLLELARNSAVVTRPSHRLNVHSSAREGLLDEGSRDVLWEAFGVPLFEHLIGPDGEVIAAECDAHRGLHLAQGVDLPAGFLCIIERGRCACGRSSPRLVRLEPFPVHRAAAGAG